MTYDMRASWVRLVCCECGAVSGDRAGGWEAYLTSDEPTEAAVFCPECAEREFSDRSGA